MANRKIIDLKNLNLDRENPRIGSVNSQSEALTAIVEMDVNHFATMMKSIKSNGLDPGDLFYVIKTSGGKRDYVVLDGNRRLSALKVLSQPDLLQGTALSKATITRLGKLANGYDSDVVGDLLCVEFSDRESANDWIERRHGRGLKGEERIHWSPLDIQRFQNDKTIIDTLNFVEKFSQFDDAKWQDMREALEKKSSVLDRFLSSKVGMSWMGIQIENASGEKIPTSDMAPGFLIEVLSQLFDDIASGDVDSRTYNKASDIEAYFNELPESLHPSSVRVSRYRLRDAVIKDTKERPRKTKSTSGAKTKPAKRSKVKGPRATLAPHSHPFAAPTLAKGQELLREASKVKLASLPLASAFLLRAFIEFSVDLYMDNNNLPKFSGSKALKLSQRADHTIAHLVSNRVAKKQDLQAIRRILTHTSDPASIQALNDYHHNKYSTPQADVLRNAWDQAEPLFIAIHGAAQ